MEVADIYGKDLVAAYGRKFNARLNAARETGRENTPSAVLVSTRFLFF